MKLNILVSSELVRLAVINILDSVKDGVMTDLNTLLLGDKIKRMIDFKKNAYCFTNVCIKKKGRTDRKKIELVGVTSISVYVQYQCNLLRCY